MAKSLKYLLGTHGDLRWDPHNPQKCQLLLNTILVAIVHVLTLRVCDNSQYFYIFIFVTLANSPPSDPQSGSCVCTS